jgi:Fic family protein
VNDQRHSKADEPSLVLDEEARAVREAENAIRQIDTVLNVIDGIERDGRPFRLRASLILTLHRIALEGLSRYAGNWRPSSVSIEQSKHSPPPVHLVPSLMEEMCDWLEANWENRSAVALSAYVMWRLNWIHPFDDGNGRTSRAVSYLVLCAKTKARLPGRVTIPEIIARNRRPYYEALEQIDESCLDGEFDLAPMVNLLEDCLAQQLMSVWTAATSSQEIDSSTPKFH